MRIRANVEDGLAFYLHPKSDNVGQTAEQATVELLLDIRDLLTIMRDEKSETLMLLREIKELVCLAVKGGTINGK